MASNLTTKYWIQTDPEEISLEIPASNFADIQPETAVTTSNCWIITETQSFQYNTNQNTDLKPLGGPDSAWMTQPNPT